MMSRAQCLQRGNSVTGMIKSHGVNSHFVPLGTRENCIQPRFSRERGDEDFRLHQASLYFQGRISSLA